GRAGSASAGATFAVEFATISQLGLVVRRIAYDWRGRWKCISAADRDRWSDGADKDLWMDRADGERDDVARQELPGDERYLFESRRAGAGSGLWRAAAGFGAAGSYRLGISSDWVLWHRLPVIDEQGVPQ